MVQKAKKLLGVDFGEARTGLAYSDDLGLCAIAMGNVKSYNREKAAKEIAEKAAEIGAELIVIGKPLNMNGTAGEKVAAVEEFAAMDDGGKLAAYTATQSAYDAYMALTAKQQEQLSEASAVFEALFQYFNAQIMPVA